MPLSETPSDFFRFMDGVLRILALGLALYLVIQLIIGPNGFIRIKEQSEYLHQLECEVSLLEKNNKLLENIIAFRRSDLFLETLARRELGYVDTNERLVRWIEKNE